MIKNKLLKIVSMMLVIVMITMICSASYASSVTVASIKASLEKCLKQRIIIKGSDGSITILNENEENESEGEDIITDSTIGGKIAGKEYTIFDYSVQDNVCTFNANFEDLYELIQIDINNVTQDKLNMSSTVLALVIYMYAQSIFTSVASNTGIDLSLAYTYFAQQLENISSNENKIDMNVTNDIFSFIIKSNDKNVLEKATLKIYIDNLVKLSKANINGNKTTYKVFLGDLPDSEKENIETEYKINNIGNKVYTGKEIKPSLEILDKKFDVEVFLELGKDYTVSYSNNINTGKATVTITGIGFKKGKLTKIFYIVPKKVEGLKAKKQGKNSVTLQWTKNGGNVTGYKVYYYDYSKKAWKYSGKTKSTSYEVKGLTNGTTYKFKVRAYKSIDGNQYFGSYSTSVRTSTKTKTPKITKVTAGKKNITVKFDKVSKADGYKIEYSTDKNFKKNNKTVKVSKKLTSKTISKLKSKKKYYVRIRTYRTVDEKKVYSSYSNVKSIKAK